MLFTLSLTMALLASTDVSRPLRVFVDAGHGAPSNPGNVGCFCQVEQDHMLTLQNELVRGLEARGFVARGSRLGGQPTYAQRLRDAAAFRADVIISLHSDARGDVFGWYPYGESGPACHRSVGGSQGFAVLWSERGEWDIVSERQRLGRAVSEAMSDSGFQAYGGADYRGLYRGDEVPGCFVDIRPEKKSVWMLRASPSIPTVILETHHALDVEEARRWTEPGTVEAFVNAMAVALDRWSRERETPRDDTLRALVSAALRD